MPKFIEEFVKTFPRFQIAFRPLGKVIHAFDRFYALPAGKFFQREGSAILHMDRAAPTLCSGLRLAALLLSHDRASILYRVTLRHAFRSRVALPAHDFDFTVRASARGSRRDLFVIALRLPANQG